MVVPLSHVIPGEHNTQSPWVRRPDIALRWWPGLIERAPRNPGCDKSFRSLAYGGLILGSYQTHPNTGVSLVY